MDEARRTTMVILRGAQFSPRFRCKPWLESLPAVYAARGNI
jgi:hypothetical protein